MLHNTRWMPTQNGHVPAYALRFRADSAFSCMPLKTSQQSVRGSGDV